MTKNSSGFTLLEVLIAITIFAIFLTAYVISQGQNLRDSRMLEENILLRRLAEQVINDIHFNPPQFSRALTLAPVTKKFENEYSHYQYTIEYKVLEMPNFPKILGANKEGQKTPNPLENLVYKNIKENIEKILWQVSVTIKNLNSESTYVASTWIKDHKAQMSISLPGL